MRSVHNGRPRRRVLLISDTVGGVWTYTLALAAGLHSKGTIPIIAALGPGISDQQQKRAWQAGATVHDYPCKLEWMESPWQELDQAKAWLLDLHRSHRFDLVHSNMYATANLSWQVPCVLAAHSCVYTWWRTLRGHAPPADWERYYHEVCAAIKHAAAVVAPSRAMLKQFCACYGRPAYERVIYNGLFRPADVCRHKRPFIISAGRFWDEAKNIRILADVAPALSWPVYVAGADTADAHRASNLHLLGPLTPEMVHDRMNDAAVYVHPARYEPFGLSVLEAGLRGCALVLGRIDSLMEIWGDAAVYADPQDGDELTRAIESLARDPRYRQKMAERAYRQAQRYSAAKMAGRYDNLYEQVLGRHHVPPRQRIPAVER